MSVVGITTLLDTTTTYYYSGTSAPSLGLSSNLLPLISTAESILSAISTPRPVQSFHGSSRSEESGLLSAGKPSAPPSLSLPNSRTEDQATTSHIRHVSSTTLVSKTRQTTTDGPLASAGTSRRPTSQADTGDNAVLLGVLIPFTLILVALLIFGAWLASRWWRRRRVTAAVLGEQLDSFDRTWIRPGSDDFSVQSYGVHEADGKMKLTELGGDARAELEGAYAHG